MNPILKLNATLEQLAQSLNNGQFAERFMAT